MYIVRLPSLNWYNRRTTTIFQILLISLVALRVVGTAIRVVSYISLLCLGPLMITVWSNLGTLLLSMDKIQDSIKHFFELVSMS